MSQPDPIRPKETQTDVVPLTITRDGDSAISISWSDGTMTRWTASVLRNTCPCATCREKKRGEAEKREAAGKLRGLPVLSAAEARPLRIESMRPVGSYAYSIGFSDGHDSGIFPFVMLHRGDQPT
ncbi:hypothetical protein Poly51_16820 [Rubripirellula tenax]|uniref:Gamma-butyrobetaine hydroxylase-like N-terminal domain-containing protein n=1 Tax=Rubripirellula tenax TaxID=2528015 RepID=A0A5C6FDS9_9BACT|nr:DUF971 domain-containing protein [Rubripirellula tenax]TWU58902.1 hypothetical protein Poly51_16820 [Rubripirellula tenax]